MVRRFRPLLLLAFAGGILALILAPLISGGEKVRSQVILSTKTNDGVVGYFGGVSEIRWSGGRDGVELDFDGNRNGSISLYVLGTRTNGEIEVDWTKKGTNSVEINKVWRLIPSKDQELLWPVQGHGNL